MLVVSISDFLWFVDHALDEMMTIVGQLGDDTANRRPDLAGANSPYAILRHCLGVMEYWGGAMVAGRVIARDRDAEFRAHGPVAELLHRTVAARRQLAADLSAAEPLAAVRGQPLAAVRGPVDPEDAELPFGRTQGGVLLHILEELAQHLGQMQLSRDVLLGVRAAGQG